MNGQPVGYLVSGEESHTRFHPAENPNRSQPAPELEARLVNGHWEVTGTEDRELIAQVVEEIGRLDRVPHIGLSAAP